MATDILTNILAILGLLALLGSIEFTAIQGTQLAVIGVGFILLALFVRVGKQQRANSPHRDDPNEAFGGRNRPL